MAADSPRLRLSVLGVVAVSLFAALFARLWYLQVIGTEEYQLAAQVQNTREIAIEAPRGRLLDAKGRVVVENRVSIIVTVDPRRLEELEEDRRDAVMLRLAEELSDHGQPTKVADLESRLADPQYSPVEPKPVAVDVSEELEVFLIERHDEFPAVDVRREAVRTYPYGRLAAHVLGYVGRITEEEYDEYMGDGAEPTPKPYEADDHIGKTGIERVYEDHLRGTPGVRTIEVDARGEPIRTISYRAPEPGDDLQLTIDVDVQALTEQALEQGLAGSRARPPRSGGLHRAPAGSIVVLDPQTAGVRAMASYPTYDPAEFVNGISQERYEELLGDEAASDPFTNRAIAGQYAPGSTFKLVTAYAALRSGMINENTSYLDSGVYTAQGCSGGRCTFQNAQGSVYGAVNVERAITVSSDVFFYWLGDKFWVEQDTFGETALQDAAEDLGLGRASGIPLPFEQAGHIPTPERRQQRHDDNPEAFPFPEWYSGDNIITAIGQGDVLTTPLQLANLYGTFANRGTLHEPNVVSKILVPGGDPEDPADVIEMIEPAVVRQLEMPDPWWQPMYRGFVGVTSTRGGTATGAFGDWDHAAWPVGGKTGTAEVDNKADTALFVGFGPANDPRYVVSIVLEESGFGGDAAAPVARWLLQPLAGQAPMPTARTLAEQASPVECPDESDAGSAGDSTSSTSSTSSTVIDNPLLADPCTPLDPLVTAPVGGGSD